MELADVVIVGGGIAGGALATVLATAGVRVLTLERQPEYRDHVRGEILWPWGVRVARRLNLERLLLGAGAKVVPRLDLYDEGSAEPLAIEVGEVLGGIEDLSTLPIPTRAPGSPKRREAQARKRAGGAVMSGSRPGCARACTGREATVRITKSPAGSWSGPTGAAR